MGISRMLTVYPLINPHPGDQGGGGGATVPAEHITGTLLSLLRAADPTIA